ncbi:hypothetical protein VNI00_010298 [Paramarasmius palmivorus]|uniref:Cytochrome P450 n=1 Tax=Paramarasmius palmivorus TaxID=297713 RepID=A0AAW0CLJ7_9AGAR
MLNTVIVASLLFIAFAYLLQRKRLDGIRGPKGEGYLLGVEHKLQSERELGKLTFQWTREYGTTYQIPGCFGEAILVTCDPRAIHHIIHEHVVRYPASKDTKKFYELLFGRGVLWADGDVHKRHRRVLSPAFSVNHMKSFIPLFQQYAEKLSEKWTEQLQGGSHIIDVVPWCHKVTLDIIGETSFSYQFGALENIPNELTEALHAIEWASVPHSCDTRLTNLDRNLGLAPSIPTTLLQAAIRHLPRSFGQFQAKYFPVDVDRLSMRYLEVSSRKANEFMRRSDTLSGHSGAEPTSGERDILSVLVKANQAEDPKKRLAEHEVTSQISTLVQAGHHTTGYSLAWILYELSQHPADQQKVYHDIMKIRARGGAGFTAEDYDELADGWLGACVKVRWFLAHYNITDEVNVQEALRLHPILPQLRRTASYRDILPLHYPICSYSGADVNCAQIVPGQTVIIDVAMYNRLESVWGSDANKWSPGRFFEPASLDSTVSVGMVSSLLTFSGGSKGCLGWRFALMELHALIAGLLEQFQFELPQGVDIRDGVMVVITTPNVAGREEEGPMLPLFPTTAHINTISTRAVIALTCVAVVYFANVRRRLDELRGPQGDGYLLGVEYRLTLEEQIGDLTFQWAEEFGPTYKIPGCFGETILVTADPRAIHHVLQERVLNYPPTKDRRRFLEKFFGRGIVWAVAEDHKRHRRVLSPAFSTGHIQGFIPLFRRHVSHLADMLYAEVQKQAPSLDIIPWLNKSTLDIIGESAFNHDFGSLVNTPSKLAPVLHDVDNISVQPSPIGTLVQALPRYLPDSVCYIQAKYFPTKMDRVLAEYIRVSTELAREFMQTTGLLVDEHGVSKPYLPEKDVLSILEPVVTLAETDRANKAESPNKRLAEHEVLAQISTLIQAGHHTTAFTLAWVLCELSRHSLDQQKVYEEIQCLRDKRHGDLIAEDYDELSEGWLGACVKQEALRLHPIVHQLLRSPDVADTIPLQIPIESATGGNIPRLQVLPGQRIVIDITMYNRLKVVWGDDADTWNPSRFFRHSLTSSHAVTVGMTSNLLSFSGGSKGCIGWRFALMEIYVLLAGLLDRFQFGLPSGVEIKDFMTVICVPVIIGKEEMGTTLPLIVEPRTK